MSTNAFVSCVLLFFCVASTLGVQTLPAVMMPPKLTTMPPVPPTPASMQQPMVSNMPLVYRKTNCSAANKTSNSSLTQLQCYNVSGANSTFSCLTNQTFRGLCAFYTSFSDGNCTNSTTVNASTVCNVCTLNGTAGQRNSEYTYCEPGAMRATRVSECDDSCDSRACRLSRVSMVGECVKSDACDGTSRQLVSFGPCPTMILNTSWIGGNGCDWRQPRVANFIPAHTCSASGMWSCANDL